ncbi:nuclear transport factor 2 family protein [Cupriavidus basilensis]
MLKTWSSSMWRGPCTCGARVRAPVCFRKIAGRWRVAHEHASMPVSFNP